MLPYAVNGFSICSPSTYVQSMAFLYAVLLSLRASVLNQFQHQCLNVGNAFRSMQSGFQTSLSSKLPYLPNVVLPYFGQRFRIHANGKIFRLNLGNAFKSTQLSIQTQIQFGQSQSQIDLQTQSIRPSSAISTRPPNAISTRPPNAISTLQCLLFSQNRRIIPPWNFSLKSSQPSKSALAIGKSAELFLLILRNLAIQSPRCLRNFPTMFAVS